MKPSVADKEEKTSSKAGPKVFDVAHPGKSKPSASSRPIIVSNRPILQDPMVSSSQQPSDVDTSEKPNPSAIKIRLKPLDDDNDDASDAKVEKPEKDEKADNRTIAVLAAEKAAEKAEEKSDETPAPEAEATNKPSEELKTEDDTEKSAPEPDTTNNAKADTSAEPEATADENLPVDDNKDAKETAALEAVAKKQEEIRSLVESREYFLPINAVERRRSKVVSILGLLLIVALGLMLVDLLLDVGFIRLGGVHSLTHFFSS
jgi:hypothetical protein